MQGVTFGEKHSYWDWGLILKEHPIVSPPEPKKKIVEIPAADGHIDLSEALTGRIHYQCREITCRFTMAGQRERWPLLYSDILNYLHGKRLEIRLDNDPDYFYTGRVEISEWEPGENVAEVTILATVAPYKTAYADGKEVL